MFHTLLYQPLFNALIWLYNTIAFKDLGIAIIVLTILIRFILFPLFYKSLKNQALLQKIQPHVKKIQADHKDNKERQAQALMALYKEHKVNPFSGFFLLLLQLPVLIALYQVFLNIFKDTIWQDLYSFIARPEAINHLSLGLIDLGERSIVIVALAVIIQYFQAKLSLPKKQGTESGKKDPSEIIGKQMTFIGPILTLMILISLPAAIGIYWLTTSLFSLVQQYFVNKKIAAQHPYGGISKSSDKAIEPNRLT